MIPPQLDEFEIHASTFSLRSLLPTSSFHPSAFRFDFPLALSTTQPTLTLMHPPLRSVALNAEIAAKFDLDTSVKGKFDTGAFPLWSSEVLGVSIPGYVDVVPFSPPTHTHKFQ